MQVRAAGAGSPDAEQDARAAEGGAVTYKCTRCNNAATCAVWGWRLCDPCVDAWNLEAPEPGSDFDDAAAAYQSGTRKWVKEGTK